MKALAIASNRSGGGKTTITMGLIKALCKRGYKVQGYKVGPDYIDPGFHSFISRQDSRNLDIHLMGEEGVKASFARGRGDIGIVEGVMGFYDGMGLSTYSSTYHTTELLDIPVVLVLSPKAQIATLFAEINGLLTYKKNNIIGIILNNISPTYYQILKDGIEKDCNLKVFGYLPADCKLEIGSRHLGLIQSSEIKDLEEKIDYLSTQIEKYIDIEAIIENMKESKNYEDNYHIEKSDIRIAIAKDKAFDFYYKENIELLERLGKVEYFSPLEDKKLPKDIDFLYIGGGYPDVFSKELSKNQSLLKDIKEKLDAGLMCYAECGGLMYLTQEIEGMPMVGFFDGKCYTSNRLQNFGYATMEVSKDNGVLPCGLTINCHEFHRSYVELKEDMIYKITKEKYDGTIKTWECGYCKNNTIGTYTHTHFFGNIELLNHIKTKILENKRDK